MPDHSNGRGQATAPQVAPFQGRGFTAEERDRVREQFRRDYGFESNGARAVLRAFTRSLSLRRLILDASRPFTDPTRHHRPDRDFGGSAVPTLYVEGFSASERSRIGRALVSAYLSESQAVRSLALAYEATAEVRQAVHRMFPPIALGK